MNKAKIDELVRYYGHFSSELGRPKRTSIGIYHPTLLDDVRTLFDKLHADGSLEPFDVFLDAGSGDGRIVALASLYDVHAYGIEGDVKIHTLAEQRVENAKKEGILPAQYPKKHTLSLGYGDFLDIHCYQRAIKIKSDTIEIFFNANDNCLSLAKMLEQIKNKKTRYLIVMQNSGLGIEQIMKLRKSYRDSTGRLLGKMYQTW